MFNYYIVQKSSPDVAVSSGVSAYLILATFKKWKTYISRATVAGGRTSGALEVQMMMMMNIRIRRNSDNHIFGTALKNTYHLLLLLRINTTRPFTIATYVMIH